MSGAWLFARPARGLLLACTWAICLHCEAAGIDWRPDAALNRALPAGIKVFRGTGDNLCAVYALVDTPAVWRSASFGQQRLTPLEFARGQARPPAVVINGGYFDARSNLSLVVEDSVVRARGVSHLARAGSAQAVARAALGKMPDGRTEIRAVAVEEVPRQWNPVWAIGGGPILVAGGVKHVRDREEWFDAQSGIQAAAPAPRTAVALLGGGRVLFLVVDGRSEHSRGVTLDELADMLLELGAQDAMNVDGGGSSAMVVNGVLVTHPSDKAGLRPVASVLWAADS
jgi:exopolysaccharide biosynthesis protein